MTARKRETGQLRSLIADDHESTRRGIVGLLSHRPDWEICAEAVDGIDAVQKAKRFFPDVVLMDVSMPRMSGLEATRIIRRELPQSAVIIVTQNDPTVAHQQAVDVDAQAFVSKSKLTEDLLSEIGRISTNRCQAASISSNDDGLFPSEQRLFSGLRGY
jgi:DNA-binding NarL/FixJ family response regulator